MGDPKITTEQLQDAEQVAKVLASVPPEKKDSLVIAINSFMAGMQAGAQLATVK